MINIVYVDEQPEEASKFLRAASESKQFTIDQFVELQPKATVDETIEIVNASCCKALITDYRLNEYDCNVGFNGADLVREWQRQYYRFPCFVVTAFAGQAIHENLDTNIIHSKSDIFGNDGTPRKELDLPFFTRVRQKIVWYEKLVGNMQNELRQLASKEDPLSPQETEKLIELDGNLEKMLWATSTITKEQKKAAIQEFPDLIKSAKDLVAKIRRELDRK